MIDKASVAHVNVDTQSMNTAKKKSATNRELIEPHKGDKRYVRRNAEGQFKESDDVGKSLSQDRRRKAKTAAPKGQGDRGDQKKK